MCPWNPPGKKTGVGCHSLLWGATERVSMYYFTFCIRESFCITYLPVYLSFFVYLCSPIYCIRLTDFYIIQSSCSFNDLIHFDAQMVPDVAGVSYLRLAHMTCWCTFVILGKFPNLIMIPLIFSRSSVLFSAEWHLDSKIWPCVLVFKICQFESTSS